METDWRKRQRLELRERIYETALDLFQTKGYDVTTMQQIASAAGIGKGTFFNHFPSKDCVLQEWYRRITETALNDVTVGQFETGRDAIIALSVRLASGAAENSALWDAKSGATSNPLLRLEESNLDQKVTTFIRKQIQKEICSGHLASSTDVSFITDMVLTVLTGTGRSWTVSGHSWDLVETTMIRVAFVLNAAMPTRESSNAQHR
jgi:AcrR family transcriptional regulator